MSYFVSSCWKTLCRHLAHLMNPNSWQYPSSTPELMVSISRQCFRTTRMPKKKLTIVRVNNLSQYFLEFEFKMTDEDLLMTLGEHFTATASFDCICQVNHNTFAEFVLKQRVKQDWLALFSSTVTSSGATMMRTPSIKSLSLPLLKPLGVQFQ